MNPYLGTVKLFATKYVPRGWMRCDGQLLQIEQNPSLYALLATTYGGDGRLTFALPDLQGKTPGPNLFYAMYAIPQYPGSIHPG